MNEDEVGNCWDFQNFRNAIVLRIVTPFDTLISFPLLLNSTYMTIGTIKLFTFLLSSIYYFFIILFIISGLEELPVCSS